MFVLSYLPFAIASLSSAIAYSGGNGQSAYVGCVDASYQPTSAFTENVGAKGIVSAVDCAAACFADSYTYSFFGDSGGALKCLCSNTIPPTSAVRTAGGSTASETSGQCDASQLPAIRTATCSSSLFIGSTQGVEQCFQRCPGATRISIDLSNYFCRCASHNQAKAVDESQRTVCASGRYHVYNRANANTNLGPSAGGMVRRRLRERMYQAAMREQAFCPKGLRACKIQGTSGYECIDVASELESCGGCMHGDFNADEDISKGQE
ncbi:uncharacterized protein MKK02DRAFT_42185 [Dioszegia hungarica]|uniref:WSC domain-containing protein n=1 Tax=Dioszegia hungarica TaxID=4972 RepID=A0AA38LVY2_9TREE|nr:uncharacterized protein MKK02DRAFT_42185 [Dioszegia hungarica]KAI9637815.1 hypothetical protein MKK02DRAFT_42185 [Dioszegia hungarica]